jgi:hypothetical protein
MSRSSNEHAKRYGWDDLSVMRTAGAETVAQFRKTMPFGRLFKEEASYEARPGHNLGDCCFQKLCELRKLDIDIPDKYQVDMAIGGIPDDTVAHTVRSAQYDEPNALYAFINILGDMPSRGRESTIGRIWNGRQRPRKKESGVYRRPARGATGAERWEIARRCNKSEKEGYHPSKQINILDRVKSVGNLYEISVRVNGKRVDSLVDTDSAGTVMHSSVARKLDIATRVITDALLRMFVEQTVVANKLARVTITIQNAKADMDSFAVPDGYTRHPAIVARNFILQDRKSLDI